VFVLLSLLGEPGRSSVVNVFIAVAETWGLQGAGDVDLQEFVTGAADEIANDRQFGPGGVVGGEDHADALGIKIEMAGPLHHHFLGAQIDLLER